MPARRRPVRPRRSDRSPGAGEAVLVAAALAGQLVGLWLMTVLIPALRRFIGGRVVAVAATAALLVLAAGGVVAAVPLLLGLGLRSGVLPVDADPELVNSLVRFGVVWAALHALSALDPQATDKIERTDRLLQRLP